MTPAATATPTTPTPIAPMARVVVETPTAAAAFENRAADATTLAAALPAASAVRDGESERLEPLVEVSIFTSFDVSTR